MTGLAVDDAAWASTWRRRSAADKLLLCGGLVGCALVLPAWPGSVLVGLTAVVLALGPAQVPARTFGRAVRWPLAFITVGALTSLVTVGTNGLGWGPDAAARAGSLARHALAGSAAVLLLATTTPMSDLLPALRGLRVPAAVVEVAAVTYRLLFVLLASLHAIREAQTARMGYSTAARGYARPARWPPRCSPAPGTAPAACRTGWPAAAWRPACGCCPRSCRRPAPSSPPPRPGWP
ncbi:MAG: CbiQ family ECF transporter T component [Actinomycetota bacterium]|nr:CbiQ family ECF transporter T component [Actinomycetota bacterium]